MWVEYGTWPELDGLIPAPVPAVKSLPPEWKELERFGYGGDVERNDLFPSVKGCLPFFDAISDGLVIPLPWDLVVHSSDNGKTLKFWWRGEPYRDVYEPSVDWRNTAQAGGFADNPVLKFHMPYFIRTSNNLVCLWQPPINRKPIIHSFAGMVNANHKNGYVNRVNVLAEWRGGDGEFTFRQGEPLAQVSFLPAKHPQMKKVVVDDKWRFEAERQLWAVSTSLGVYKKMFRGSRK
jgi:hypothetical protein